MESAAYARLYPREACEKTLASGARGDGRPLGRARARTCATGVASGALGSALAKHGATTACAGVTATIATPDATRPEEGFLEIAVDYAPQASEDARDGRTRGRREAAAAACASAVANAAVLGKDLKQLCVERGTFAWRVRVDVIVLCDDGGAADCAVTAVMAALRDCVLPEVAVTRGKVALEGDGTAMNGDGVRKGTRLDVQTMPVCLTTALYREHLLVDPTREEEALSECEVSVVLTEDGLLRGVFKPGGEVEATEDTLMKCIAAAKLHYAASAKVVLEATEDEE
jgi:exosome complex component RRP43